MLKDLAVGKTRYVRLHSSPELHLLQIRKSACITMNEVAQPLIRLALLIPYLTFLWLAQPYSRLFGT